MRDTRFLLKTHYSQSRALIIGIDKYKAAPPLEYAVSDATEIHTVLRDEFEFPEQNIIYLSDQEATKEEILRAFHKFTKSDINVDDRLMVFYAGHGHTRTGSRGEVGYLVPYDADMDDFSTFIRWDELTRNADLVRAKHVLFVMDACYGGLALTRSAQVGGVRFLKDMMLRHSRQVLTAGKADEVVSDSGGPLPNHSVFTGHLIEALRGKAATDGGVITASGVMAYVYTKVASDKNSNQTPHYGHFDGDGDFIFTAPGLSELDAKEDRDIDRLISIPIAQEEPSEQGTHFKIKTVKSLLSNESGSIQLHDFLATEVRRFLQTTSEDAFPTQGNFSDQEFLERIEKYESASKDISLIIGCISHWGSSLHLNSLQKCISRSTDRLESQSGLAIWLGLRWYPLILQLYSAGIAAVDACRYDSLSAIFYAEIPTSAYDNRQSTFIEGCASGILDLNRSGVLKKIPGHERNHTPLSEYLFKILQPDLDDTFFLGKSYEKAFDTFEVFFALATADIRRTREIDSWGPIGRFGWKHGSRSNGPLAQIVSEARLAKESWAPIRAGLFGGSFERFELAAADYLRMADRIGWH
jgi:hypothetical protein